MRSASASIRVLGLALGLVLGLASTTSAGSTTDFDGLPFSGPESVLNNGGPAGGWTVDGNVYNNTFSSDPVYGDFWSGWAFSNQTGDSSGVAFGQYLAVPGSGADGSDGYAVATSYEDPTGVFDTIARIDLAEGRYIESLKVTNVEYVYRSITEGYPIGGAFEQGDWFKLTIQGLDASGAVTGAVEVNLATYETSLDVLSDWLLVDLTSLGEARSINFLFSTSVWNQYGPLTPSYVAVDDLTTYTLAAVPEPASWALMGVGIAAGALARRRAARRS